VERRLRILIVDDHEVVREGLNSLLQRYEEFEVIGEAGSFAEAVGKAISLLPDLVIMDVRLGEGSGIEACREIKAYDPSIKVVMLTSYSDDEAILASIAAGADGFILKQIKTEELIQDLKILSRGEVLLDAAITRKIMDHIRKGQNPREESHQVLSGTELRILGLIAEGKTNKEIGLYLGLSEKTVRNYISALLGKLQFSNRAEAAAYAVRHHIVP